MSANKTAPENASVGAFLTGLPAGPRRQDAERLVALMQRVTGESPRMWGTSIVGFGEHHYVHDSGREGDMPRLSFAPRKTALVIYGVMGFEGAGPLLARLGRHTTGKGCVYVKALADVDESVLEALLRGALARRED